MAIDAKTVAVGDALPSLVKGPITREHLKRYADASGDHNPIHLDEEFAKSAGYPSVFAHGMLSMGYLGELLVTAGGAPEAVRKFKARFAQHVRCGHFDVLEIEGCRGGPPNAHLFLVGAALDAKVSFHDQRDDARFGSSVRMAGPCNYREEIRDAAIGNPDLVSV